MIATDHKLSNKLSPKRPTSAKLFQDSDSCAF